MLIIGTAGHIDHGKSSIVKRITGTDPDRLPEEKNRGMTIDLGFAFYKTPSKDTIAFIDVPGHERFVKNMVAGVGGIDAVMLVIAADDGWMPQSEEHFQIVRLLGIQRGFIVINKIDLADKDWLELLNLDIREKVKGTFLETAPIFNVSSVTGEGFKELINYLNTLPSQIESQKDIGKARLYIDRSFVRPGIGGVVTGTLRDGNLTVGQTVTVWPSMKVGKIRSLHSNNQEVEKATPGQRTALSFTGIDKEYLLRGGVVIDRQDFSSLIDKNVLALSLELLPEINLSLKDRRRLLLIIGTTEVEGVIRLYQKNELLPGHKGIVFFKSDQPVYTLVGDNFIMRLPTPMMTIGGGQVIAHLQTFPKQKNINQYQYLEKRVPLNLKNLIISELHKNIISPVENFLIDAIYAQQEVKKEVDKLVSEGILSLFEGNIYLTNIFKENIEMLKNKIASYFKNEPHLKGITMEQIISIYGAHKHQIELMVKYLLSIGELTKTNELYNLSGRGMELKGVVKMAHDEIITTLKNNRFIPPNISTFANKGKAYKDAIKYILDTKEGYKCGSQFIFLFETWKELITFIKNTISEKGSLKVSNLKDSFNLSRKYSIPILEETDRLKLTFRDGDIRIKGERFENEEFDL